MSGWLAGLGADPSPSSMGGTENMDHGHGTMGKADTYALEAASGDEAAQLFLSGMIKHHQGVVRMAQTELDAGQDPDAKALAETTMTSQGAETIEMHQLLGR